MVWKPGESGNPGGRAVGTRNRRVTEIWVKLKARGDVDPADYLSERLTISTDHEERRDCAAILMPYLYSKNASKPDPQFIEELIEIPAPTNIQEAYGNVTVIQSHYASGRIGGLTHDRLLAATRAYIDGVAVGEKLAELGSSTADQIIRVEGGLPPLPGTNIEMHVMPREFTSEAPAPEPTGGPIAPGEPAPGSATEPLTEPTTAEVPA